MRYPDIEASEDPLFFNITTLSPHVVGVFAPETTIYIQVNDNKRIQLDTDIGGKFEYTFDRLTLDDVLTFTTKEGTMYRSFWVEKIRE